MRNPEITKKTSTPTKPPGKPRQLDVVGDDQEDGDGAQPVDVGPEPARRAPADGRAVGVAVSDVDRGALAEHGFAACLIPSCFVDGDRSVEALPRLHAPTNYRSGENSGGLHGAGAAAASSTTRIGVTERRGWPEGG